jgi:hypothetical protein
MILTREYVMTTMGSTIKGKVVCRHLPIPLVLSHSKPIHSLRLPTFHYSLRRRGVGWMDRVR